MSEDCRECGAQGGGCATDYRPAKQTFLPKDTVQAVADAIAEQALSRTLRREDDELTIRAWAMDTARLAVRVVRETEQSERSASTLEPLTQTPEGPYGGGRTVIDLTDSLHPRTKALVVRFAEALALKLAVAQVKYGYEDGWASNDWMPECRARLREHLEKGDPRDVAAYCAFLWFHKEPTFVPTEQAKREVTDDMTDRALRIWLDHNSQPGTMNPTWQAMRAALEAALNG